MRLRDVWFGKFVMTQYKTIREVIKVYHAKTPGLYQIPNWRYDQKTAKNHHFGGAALTKKRFCPIFIPKMTNFRVFPSLSTINHPQKTHRLGDFSLEVANNLFLSRVIFFRILMLKNKIGIKFITLIFFHLFQVTVIITILSLRM